MNIIPLAHDSAVLRTLPLSGSLNSRYAVRLHSPKPFATLRASHTRKTLYVICGSLNMLFDLVKNYEDVKWRWRKVQGIRR